jgi:hypothetical protein
MMSPGVRAVFATALSLVVYLCSAPAVLAADTPAPVPTPTPATVTSTITRTAPVANGDLVILVIATLIFAALALAVIFRYMYAIQARYYAVADTLGRRGQAVKATLVQAFATADSNLESAGEGAGEVKLTLTGPSVVEVGQEAEYTAALSDNTPTDAAIWSVEPRNAAAVRSAKADSNAILKITPMVEGPLTLSVTLSAPDVRATLQVTAVTPPRGSVEIPFVGRGYGSIAIAIVIVTAVIILALAGVLGAESVGALLAALLGYIFGVTTASRGGEREGDG